MEKVIVLLSCQLQGEVDDWEIFKVEKHPGEDEWKLLQDVLSTIKRNPLVLWCCGMKLSQKLVESFNNYRGVLAGTDLVNLIPGLLVGTREDLLGLVDMKLENFRGDLYYVPVEGDRFVNVENFRRGGGDFNMGWELRREMKLPCSKSLQKLYEKYLSVGGDSDRENYDTLIPSINYQQLLETDILPGEDLGKVEDGWWTILDENLQDCPCEICDKQVFLWQGKWRIFGRSGKNFIIWPHYSPCFVELLDGERQILPWVSGEELFFLSLRADCFVLRNFMGDEILRTRHSLPENRDICCLWPRQEGGASLFIQISLVDNEAQNMECLIKEVILDTALRVLDGGKIFRPSDKYGVLRHCGKCIIWENFSGHLKKIIR